MKNMELQKKIINKAMKEFRGTKAFAKEHGEQINSIFYFGERLTPLQIDMIKDLIYALSDLNSANGKNAVDDMIMEILQAVVTEAVLSEISKTEITK